VAVLSTEIVRRLTEGGRGVVCFLSVNGDFSK
jgi:hypothetical protein